MNKDQEIELKNYIEEWEKFVKKDFKGPKPEQPQILQLSLDHMGGSNIKLRLKEGWYDYPKIVVFNEKHGELYYIFNPDDPEAQGRIALKVVKERFECGWYYDPKGDEPEKLSYTNDSIKDLPKDLRQGAIRNLGIYKREKKDYDRAKRQWTLAQAANNMAAAVQLLVNRQDYEYEKFEIINPTRVE